MTPKFLLITVILVSGCTTMESYNPGATKTLVGDEEYLVRKVSEGTYQGMVNHVKGSDLLAYDARIWSNSIIAIEQVTGCKVIPGSERNSLGNTVAAVDCGDEKPLAPVIQ